jgi:hypothetical protein
MTKRQRRANASRRSKQRRVSVALKKFLAAVKPSAAKGAGASFRRNPGGSITIIPLKKIPNRARRAAR